MNASRFLLIFVACVTTASVLPAQTLSSGNHEPTKWTAEAKTIPAQPQTIAHPAASVTAFPSLAQEDAVADGDASTSKPVAKISGPAVTVTSSLAVVLGLFAALVWMTRKFGSRGISQGVIPREVFQSLGTTSIDPRTRVTMIRCGDRILVLAQTNTGVHPLAEITDPDEVRHLTASCLGDAGRTFGSTLRSIEQEPVPQGFAGVTDPPAVKRGRSRLFATA